MTYWRDAHALGLIADSLEALTGRQGFYQEKRHCFPVFIEEVQTGFGNASLELVPISPDGSLCHDDTFSLLGPLERFRVGVVMIGVASANLVIGEEEVATFNALLQSGATPKEIREKSNLLMSEGPTLNDKYAEESSTDSLKPLRVSALHDCRFQIKGPRSPYVYLAITSDQICLDAFIPSYGRLVLRTDQYLQPIFLLWELALVNFPNLTEALIAHERKHARSTGAKHVLFGESMSELFGDDQGARWAFGCREGGLCASSLMSDADLIRIVTFIAKFAGWHAEATAWPDRSLRKEVTSTYRMTITWGE